MGGRRRATRLGPPSAGLRAAWGRGGDLAAAGCQPDRDGRQDVTISKRLRYEILRRDNHACRYCGATAPEAKLTADHIVPVALGGTDDPSNLVAACVDCNSGKSSSSPDAHLVAEASADALRWRHALVQASEAMLADHRRREGLRDAFLDAWNNWTYKDWKTGERVPFDLPNGWQASIDNVLAAGLPVAILRECVDFAMGRKGVDDEFRYMCGIAWRKVSEMRAIAAALASTEEPHGEH